MKNKKIIIALFAIITFIVILFGFLWQLLYFQKPKTDENLAKTIEKASVTRDEAVQAVRSLSEVKNYEALLAQAGKAATIEAEDNDTEWNVHVYEIVTQDGISHSATFGWYQVDKYSGEVFSENPIFDDVSGEKLPIQPAELMPYVSPNKARSAICTGTSGELFEEACKEKFNEVGKNDIEKIGELFSLIKKIEGDSSISDYERYLLAQAVFASFPAKDSPLSYRSDFSEMLAKLGGIINNTGVVHAEDLIMSEEEFKELMKNDLQKVISNLPEGDNAFVLNVMVSKYSWVNGERQPLYSDQYGESYDPYPGVSTEARDERTILYHVKSVVGSRSTSQAITQGPFKGTGEMIAYSFSIMSWNSPEYGKDSVLVLAEAGPDERYMNSRIDLSEKNYRGENLLSGLMNSVKFPPHTRIAKDGAAEDLQANSEKSESSDAENNNKGQVENPENANIDENTDENVKKCKELPPEEQEIGKDDPNSPCYDPEAAAAGAAGSTPSSTPSETGRPGVIWTVPR